MDHTIALVIFLFYKTISQRDCCHQPFFLFICLFAGARFGLIVTKIGLIRVLREFEVSVSDDTPIPIEFDMKSVLLQSNVGLPLKFQTAATKAA